MDVTAMDGSTALHLAAQHGYLDACRVLIGGGADVNTVDEAGFNSLMKVAQMGHVDMTKLLVQNGVNVQSKIARLKDSAVYRCREECYGNS